MNDRAREVFDKTWLAAALFAGGFVMLDFFYGWQGLMTHRPGLLGLVALVVTPPLWWALAARRSLVEPARGAVVGIVCAIGIVMLPTLVLAATSLLGADRNDARAFGLIRYAAVAIVWTGVVPLGAALGALAAIIHKARTEPAPASWS